jgi:hypothetical protein
MAKGLNLDALNAQRVKAEQVGIYFKSINIA